MTHILKLNCANNMIKKQYKKYTKKDSHAQKE